MVTDNQMLLTWKLTKKLKSFLDMSTTSQVSTKPDLILRHNLAKPILYE